MKSLLSLFAAVLLVCGTPAFASGPVDPNPAVADLSTMFNIDAPIHVPGKSLKSGSYSIRVVDHLADRVLLQIENANGKTEARFLAVPNTTLPHSSTGPIAYSDAKHGTSSMQGFTFPGGSTVEFVYPKDEAAGIAKNSGAHVLAIDPASEGRPGFAKLSKDDMQVVTLWTLSPTRIGPENASQAAIEAQRYQPPQPSAPVQPVQMASLNAGPPVPASTNSIGANRTAQAPLQPIATRSVRPVKHTATVTSLPHTASQLPLTLLAGLLLIGGALVLRAWRLYPNAR